MVGILDLVFIVILAISILLGLIRGAIREVLSLVGLGASVYLAFKFSDTLSKTYVSQIFEDTRISYIVTFVLIIVATLFAVTLINLFFSQLLKASGLSFVNRFLGMIFGILRGMVICCILVLIIGFVPGITSKNWWKESSLAPIFKNTTKTSLKYLPDEVAGYFDSAKGSVNKAVNKLGLPNNNISTQQAVPAAHTPSSATQTNGDTQTQVILQSIDASRQASSQENPSANISPKSELILESYQEQ